MNTLFEKIETVIYVLCLLLIGAVCLLRHADMVMRDHYNTPLDTTRLSQLLFILAAFPIALFVFRKASRYNFINRFLTILFIPICIFALTVIGSNVISIKHITNAHKFSQTGLGAVCTEKIL